MCAFLQIKDIKHIEYNFHSDAGVMPQGCDLGCWWDKNFSVGIFDGAPSTANSSLPFHMFHIYYLMYLFEYTCTLCCRTLSILLRQSVVSGTYSSIQTPHLSTPPPPPVPLVHPNQTTPNQTHIIIIIYLRTLKTHHPDLIRYFTNPGDVCEIIVIAYHNLATL